jgi:decaprenylphospho-beta-D-erythro-pentofuranosid-2-ulose 2-reductase
MTHHFKNALIIGASSGIGEALAKKLASDGTRIALVARSEERLKNITGALNSNNRAMDANTTAEHLYYVHDVRNTEEIPELLQLITRSLGGLDLVIYAAGVMHQVAFEEYDTAKDLEMLEVNLSGAVAWLNPVAERFGRLRAGTIVGISSVAGDRGRSGAPVYNTSKAGLTTYLEALRNRIGRYGVRVVTIKPGPVDTPMTEGLSGLLWLISAEKAASIILKKAKRGSVTAYVPARWRALMFVFRSIPSFIFRRLKV